MPKVCLAITANHDKVDRDFMMHLVTMYKPADTVVSLRGEHIKSASLNEHVTEASNSGCSHILFMDVDMNFPPWTLYRLLSHRLPIVTGLYHLKSTPYAPVMGWTDEKGIAINGNGKHWKEDYCPLPRDAMVEVHWCGIGCLLVDMDVFNKVWYPPFHDEWDMESGKRHKGHDVIFCEAVRKAGYKIFADTSLDISHIGRSVINRAWVETYHRQNMDMELLRTVRSYTLEPTWWNEKWMNCLVNKAERGVQVISETLMPYIPEKATVLDMGCGDGGLLRILKEAKNCDVYGMDFSQVAIDVLKAKGIPGEAVDFRTYEANGRRAHTVILSHVLEHITDPYVDRVVKLVSDSATEQAFIIVPKEDKLWYEHVRKYDEDKLRRVVEPYFDSVDVSLVKRSSLGPSGARDHIVAHCRKNKAGGSDEVNPAVTG